MNTTRTRKTASADDVAVAEKPKRARARPGDIASPPAAVKPASARKPAATAATGTSAPVRKPTATKKPVATSTRAIKSAPTKTSLASAVAVKPVARRAARTKAADPTIDMRVRDAVVARLDAMKANDLKVIDVRGKTSITDFLVIVSGTSTRHVKAMGDEVVVTAKKFGMPPIGIEGEKDAEWMLVDLGDTVVHLMLPRIREFYGLERLWTLAEESRAAAWTA